MRIDDDEQDDGYVEELIPSNNENSDLIKLPDTLYILPLSERPFFPPQTLPILMQADAWRDSMQAITDTNTQIAGLILLKTTEREQLEIDHFHSIGTAVRVHHPVVSSGKLQFVAEGMHRFRVTEWLSKQPPYLARVTYPRAPRSRHQEQLRAYAIAIINTLKQLVPLNPLYSEELKFFLNRFNANDPSPLCDFAASLTTATKEELQHVLNSLDLRQRMQRVLVLIKKELEVVKLQVKIERQVDDKLSDQQRKFFLREQMTAIQKELGITKDDSKIDTDLFNKRIEKLQLSEQAQERMRDETQKLGMLEAGSSEYAITRNYLDVITRLPWGVVTKDKLHLPNARRMLNQEHAGLSDIKDRIVEFLAVGALRGQVAGSILLLLGPPGVGKTSIGRSIARALGRKFYHFSLGGMRDEAEIKGHRRTYIGAMPGKLIQGLQEVQTSNPVIMLDEIDKIGASYHGDPASALLEVLDPEQNHTFLDHYLDLRFDLSKVLFICTANQLDTIPRPLLDRMEIIRLPGYIAQEKLEIAKYHLWPRHLEKCGLKKSRLHLSDAAIKKIIENYAREAGVRDLDKLLGRIARKVVVKILHNKRQKHISISASQLQDYLGTPSYNKEQPMLTIGVTVGLAWTALGGVTLNVEAIRTNAQSKTPSFKLTGSLGNVMKESANIAYSYLKAHSKDYGVSNDFFEQAEIHLHVPEGATPKDGPSAGITMASALLSLAKHKRLPRLIAMTGELTLTGQVLAVGGIREKIIAARRAHIDEIILPEASRGDYDELPNYLKKGLTIRFVHHYDEVARLLFKSG